MFISSTYCSNWNYIRPFYRCMWLNLVVGHYYTYTSANAVLKLMFYHILCFKWDFFFQNFRVFLSPGRDFFALLMAQFFLDDGLSSL